MKQNHIIENYTALKEKTPSNINIVAVSKYQTVEDIKTLYDYGVRDFGENKVQDLVKKYELLPKDIRWHIIGHLQTNKIKFIAPFVYTIQSLDSIKVAKEINKQSQKHDRVIPCFLQIHIAEEESKFGFTPEEISNFIAEKYTFSEFKNIEISGIMTMATNTKDKNQISKEFELAYNIYQNYKKLMPQINKLSMGMTSDYEIAIQNNSNLIRIGSLIFKK